MLETEIPTIDMYFDQLEYKKIYMSGYILSNNKTEIYLNSYTTYPSKLSKLCKIEECIKDVLMKYRIKNIFIGGSPSVVYLWKDDLGRPREIIKAVTKLRKLIKNNNIKVIKLKGREIKNEIKKSILGLNILLWENVRLVNLNVNYEQNIDLAVIKFDVNYEETIYLKLIKYSLNNRTPIDLYVDVSISQNRSIIVGGYIISNDLSKIYYNLLDNACPVCFECFNIYISVSIVLNKYIIKKLYTDDRNFHDRYYNIQPLRKNIKNYCYYKQLINLLRYNNILVIWLKGHAQNDGSISRCTFKKLDSNIRKKMRELILYNIQ